MATESVAQDVMTSDSRSEGVNGNLEVEMTDSTDVASLRSKQQELVQQIRALRSPEEIAAFLMGMQDRLQDENKKLRVAVTSMSHQIADLSKKAAECKPSAATFTCFPMLPPELRVRIWRFAVPEARMVRLFYNRILATETVPEHITYDCHNNHHPSILHVCKEARDEILKVHPLNPETSDGIPRFFNHSLDILFIDPGVFKQLMSWNGSEPSQPERYFHARDWHPEANLFSNIRQAGINPSRLRTIVLSTSNWEFHRHILICQLFNFPMLEELILINYHMGELIGPQNLVDLNDEDLMRLEDGWVEVEAGYYKKLVERDFGVEHAPETIDDYLDLWDDGELTFKEMFEKQWIGRNLPSYEPENRWIGTERDPPRVRMMRLVDDKEAKFKLRL